MGVAVGETAVSSHEAAWKREWEVHHRRRNKQQLNRRAVFALSLIAEPLALQWSEVFLDITFLSWREAVEDGKRSATQSVEQRDFEDALSQQKARAKVLGVTERIVLECLHEVRSFTAGMSSADHDSLSLSCSRLEIFLQALDIFLSPEVMKQIMNQFASQPDGTVSVHAFLCWVLEISPQQLSEVVAKWEKLFHTWQHEWEAHHKRLRKRQLRRRAIIALGLLAEPLERQWTEAFCDAVFSAWADYVSDDHRRWALSGPRRMFERAAEAQAVASHRQSFQALCDIPTVDTSVAMQEAQRMLSRFGSTFLTDHQFDDLIHCFLPQTTHCQIQVLLDTVPRAHSGSIPVDGLLAWIFEAPTPSASAIST